MKATPTYRIVCTAVLALLASCSDTPSGDRAAAPQTSKTASLTETQGLNTWFDEQFAEELDFSPQWKTALGEKSDYDRLDDYSDKGTEIELNWRRQSVAELKSNFDYDKLDEEAKTSYDFWVYALERAEAAYKYRHHRFVLGRGGLHAWLPNFMINRHRVSSTSDMEAYISRLHEIKRALGEGLDRAKSSAEMGIRQPKFDYEFAIDEIGRVTRGRPFADGPDSPLWSDLNRKISDLASSGTITEEQAEDLLARGRTTLLEDVKPAYDEVLAWLQSDMQYAPDPALGAWSLPDGENYYNQRLSFNTSLSLTADEIHQIGLSEVARLKGEMEAIKSRVGFEGDLPEFFVFIRENPEFYYPDTDEGREEYLELARKFLGDMESRLPDYFGILPKADLEVRRVEAFREQPGAAQHYMAGTPDGSRPGIFYTHLSDMSAMPIYNLEDVAYHEGLPGHHMQISIQQELEGLPRFRTQYWVTAYSEGWGLYSELLAKEMGGFQDPYSDFGRLVGESWRAIRLVVDTGIHAKKWSEEEAVQYFIDNSPQPEATIRSEIKRYIHNPGQATAYKMGMLKILELRQRARDQLKDKFDIRGFHDTILGGGALPLPVLEKRVDRWIAAQL